MKDTATQLLEWLDKTQADQRSQLVKQLEALQPKDEFPEVKPGQVWKCPDGEQLLVVQSDNSTHTYSLIRRIGGTPYLSAFSSYRNVAPEELRRTFKEGSAKLIGTIAVEPLK